ncbi:MAG: YeeE/YedE thiosulfate transporter family protein [Bacteroidota bacterium]|nr:YeeE/YedE thiosulfate transporter family protein [Bacteroidota bacterium]
MFPLVPDLISDELNLIVALLIGIAFGFVLEQAGFSSSKKLAGVFYGYDFTVIRVFFTAGVTAMSGVIILGYIGWLDTDFIYINPTYLEGAILGGVIMGFGFIIGGYCPGTSVCGAAIGKIDAMFFVGGGLIGVFLFAEGYPMFENIYMASFLGNIRIFNSLGMSQGVFALLLIVVAVVTFIMTTKIERKVNAEGPAKDFHPHSHRLAGTGIILLGVVLLFLPDRKERLVGKVSDENFVQTHSVQTMTSDELAFRILDGDHRLQIVDVRDGKEFDSASLPGAINIKTGQLFQKEFTEILGQKHRKKVFIAADEHSEKIAALLAQEIGYENLCVLKGGLAEFTASILKYTKLGTISTREEIDTDRFRSKASGAIALLIKESKNKPAKPAALIKKVAGGC